MSEIQHKTQQDIIPITFYVFKDSTSPYTLLSYPKSVHLSIVEFRSLTKQVHMQSFQTMLHLVTKTRL